MTSWGLKAAGLLVGALIAAAPAHGQDIQNGRPEPRPATAASGAPRFSGVGGQNTPTFAGPPAGMRALAVDLFSSKNFYKDQALWSDQRYFRCNTPRQVSDIWTANRMGANPPLSASWGDCKADYPRDNIVSPYPYTSAREHYAALMARARSHGGPTVYTKATMPEWDGWYEREWSGYTARPARYDDGSEWLWGTRNQAPTILSLLTPEYRKRMVQMNYHEAVDNAPQWEASFCYPEGFLRWWAQASQGTRGAFELMMNPSQVQFLSGIADNFLRQVLIGREHVQKVPQWYGETVGFWDGEMLVTWTANVQPWTLSHSMIEFSGQMQTIETFKPALNEAGKFIGLDHETVFYDPEAFVAPLHASFRFLRRTGLDDPNVRFTYIQCLGNLRNTNGRPGQLTKADPRFIDYYGRPWAQVWETWFEKGWDKPDSEAVPKDVLDIFK